MNRAFLKAFRIKRDKALKVKQKVDRKCKPKINFVTDYDPVFPDINRILSKHKHILEDDNQFYFHRTVLGSRIGEDIGTLKNG